MSLQYPLGPYVNEQPFWLNFFAAPYSLKNFERTREGVVNRSNLHIKLPMPKEPGYQIQHNFGESNANPVGPMLSRANIANSGDPFTAVARVLQPALFYHERLFATSTYRRFSNITELTMVSEGRRQYFFQYVMVPKNPAENDQIDAICGSFRKASYPTVADLPERTYPQNLWCLQVTPGNSNATSFDGANNLTANWLGEPLVCVLQNVIVKKNDDADSVIRYLPDLRSSITLLGLLFTEFETGTYVPDTNSLRSKSEISKDYFGDSQ
jgi:hypothetical protein